MVILDSSGKLQAPIGEGGDNASLGQTSGVKQSIQERVSHNTSAQKQSLQYEKGDVIGFSEIEQFKYKILGTQDLFTILKEIGEGGIQTGRYYQFVPKSNNTLYLVEKVNPGLRNSHFRLKTTQNPSDILKAGSILAPNPNIPEDTLNVGSILAPNPNITQEWDIPFDDIPSVESTEPLPNEITPRLSETDDLFRSSYPYLSVEELTDGSVLMLYQVNADNLTIGSAIPLTVERNGIAVPDGRGLKIEFIDESTSVQYSLTQKCMTEEFIPDNKFRLGLIIYIYQMISPNPMLMRCKIHKIYK